GALSCAGGWVGPHSEERAPDGNSANSHAPARVSKDEDGPHASRRIAAQPNPWKHVCSVGAATLLSMRSQGLCGSTLIATVLGVPCPAQAAAALDGAKLHWPWALPFIGILLTIATGPLSFARFWHRHYGKLALAWSALTLIPLAIVYGAPAAAAAFTHAVLAEYLSFIVLLALPQGPPHRDRRRRQAANEYRRQRQHQSAAHR